MKRWFIVLLFFVACAWACGISEDGDNMLRTKYDQSLLREDFNLFWQILQKAHPALYEYYPEKEFQKIVDSLYLSIDGRTRLKDFNDKLHYITDKIGCSHTNIYLPAKVTNSLEANPSFFPIPLININDSLYINSVGAEIPLGSRIIAVNANPTADILKKVQVYNVSDGPKESYKRFMSGEEFSYNYLLAYGPSRTFNVVYQDQDRGRRDTSIIDAITWKEYSRDYYDNTFYYFPTTVNYDFEMRDSLNTAILTIRTFEYEAEVASEAYENFINNAFRLLDENPQVRNLVIDLRNNGGGHYKSMFHLYRYLSDKDFRAVDSAWTRIGQTPFERYLAPSSRGWKQPAIDSMIQGEFRRKNSSLYAFKNEKNSDYHPQANAFKGKVFLLINPQVMSAASNFVSMLHTSGRAVVVGEEMGGGYTAHNGFSELTYILPNSKIPFQFFVVRVLYYGNKTRTKNPKPFPDYKVGLTFDDFMDYSDPQLNFVLDSLIRDY